MTLHVKPLANVGVEVSGFDINRELDPATRDALVRLWDEHAILLFRGQDITCLLYTSPSPRDRTRSRMPSSA